MCSRSYQSWNSSACAVEKSNAATSRPLPMAFSYCAIAKKPACTSDQTARQRNQAAALVCGADGDAQEVFDARFLEMAYQHAALAKLGSKLCATAVGMAREHEVRHGRQDLETQLGEAAHEPFAARNDACARLLKP